MRLKYTGEKPIDICDTTGRTQRLVPDGVFEVDKSFGEHLLGYPNEFCAVPAGDANKRMPKSAVKTS